MIWGRCGVDVRSMWGRCGVAVASMWGRYRVDAGCMRHEIRPIRMRHLYSDFRARKEPFWEVYVVKFSLYSKLVLVISTLYRRGKLSEPFISIAVALLFNILLSWAFVTSLNYSVMCRPPWWLECCFCRFSWIYCWLLLAVLSNYFGHLVTSTFLLCKFRGLPGSTPVSFPVMSRWKCLEIKTSS